MIILFILFSIDYVGFIKKIMKQLQKGYNEIQALEIELRILETTSAPPSRPRKFFIINYCLIVGRGDFNGSPSFEFLLIWWWSYFWGLSQFELEFWCWVTWW